MLTPERKQNMLSACVNLLRKSEEQIRIVAPCIGSMVASSVFWQYRWVLFTTECVLGTDNKKAVRKQRQLREEYVSLGRSKTMNYNGG